MFLSALSANSRKSRSSSKIRGISRWQFLIPAFPESNIEKKTEYIKSYPKSHSSPFQKKSKNRKCKACNKTISGKKVMAKSNYYHIECFKCYDCKLQLESLKYFPYKIYDHLEVPLCEKHYYSRSGLICNECEEPLKGPYVSTSKKKFHLEHFRCSICERVLDQNEGYFEKHSQIFCHYHYSTTESYRCESCNLPILKQFVEVNKDIKTERWHLDCYRVHDILKMHLTSDYLGFERFNTLSELPENIVFSMEAQTENIISMIYVTLFPFIESTNRCISYMLEQIVVGDYLKGVVSTAILILKLKCLFNIRIISSSKTFYLNYNQLQNEDITSRSSSLSDHEISNLGDTLMRYFKELSEKSDNTLTLVTDDSEKRLAHLNLNDPEIIKLEKYFKGYIQLILQYCISVTLQENKRIGSTLPLHSWLGGVKEHHNISNNPLPELGIKTPFYSFEVLGDEFRTNTELSILSIVKGFPEVPRFFKHLIQLNPDNALRDQ